MTWLVFNFRDAIVYFRKTLLFCSIVLFLSIIAGIIIFSRESITINPTSLSFTTIFKNNFLVALAIMISGILTFGLFGNFIIIANGVVLGRVLIGVFNVYGIHPLIQYIGPHFIFEMTGLLFAYCISCETNKFFYNFRHTDLKIIRLKYNLVFLIVSILLLAIAAFIESNI